MKETKFVVTCKEGLHARPAAKLSQFASQFPGRIDIIYDNLQMTLKSIIGIMSLGIPEGASFSIQVEGHKEEEFMEQVHHLLLQEGLIE